MGSEEGSLDGISHSRAEPDPETARTEDTLLDAALVGDMDAFAKIFERYRSALYRRCIKRLNDDASLAEDVVQEVFIRAFTNLHSFDRSKAIWPWLATIASRMCIALQRTRSYTRYSEDIGTALDADMSRGVANGGTDLPLDAVIASERFAELWRSLSELPKRQRRVFLLNALDGWTCAEIAAAEGISVGAVHLLLFRARRKMRAARESELPALVALPFTWMRSRLQEAEERLRMATGALGERLSGAGALAVPLGILATIAVTLSHHGGPSSYGNAAYPDSTAVPAPQSQAFRTVLQNQSVAFPHKASVDSQHSLVEPASSTLVDVINPNKNATPENSYVSSLTVSPNYQDDHTLVALGRSSSSENQATALFVSEDGGATWKTRPSVFLLGTKVILPPGYPSDPRIYALGSALGLQQSDDGGETFKLVSPTMATSAAISPSFGTTDSKILVGGRRIFEYDAATGITQPALITIPISDPFGGYHSIVFSPGYPSDPRAFVSNDGFHQTLLYRCVESLCHAMEFQTGGALKLRLSPAFDRDGLGYGFSSTQLFVTGDGARTFQEIPFPLTGDDSITNMTILWDRPSSPAIFVSTLSYNPASGIYRSLDGGSSWSRTRIDLPGFGLGARELIVTPTGRLLAAAYGVVYGIACSDDMGETWGRRCPPEP